MPKTQPKPADAGTNDRRVSSYLKEFDSWRTDLKRYWPEMDRWQEMYEFHKSKAERSETDAEISLNTPFAMVESQIAKENKATIEVTVSAKPDDDIGKFDTWVSTILKDAIMDPDVAEIYGTFRKTKEKFSRALKVVGNAAAEINYCYRTAVVDGEKKVIADNPYVKTRSYKSIVFNPSMQFDRSDRYYVEDWVDYDELKGQEEKDGKGIYANLGALKVSLKDGHDNLEDTEESYIAGDIKIARKKKPIQVITRWEGTRMTVIAVTGKQKGIIIREAIDPLKLGGHNLLLGMGTIVEGRPYAYGRIAPIYKPVRAQDTVVSQGIEIVNRYLRGSYVAGPGIDIDQFMLVLANGGVMKGNPDAVKNVPVNQVPPGAFQQVDVLQQAIERAGLFSAYGAGITNQASDKTQGTAAGIQSIQSAAEPNVEIQLDDLEDMFMRPLARKYLKMIAKLMGADEVRYGLLKGENRQWVSASKGILLGKATIKDMVTSGLMSEDEALKYTTTDQPVIDPTTGQPAIDPATGQPQTQQVPIPGAEKALVFDVDWIVDVRLDNQSAADKEQRSQKELALVQLAQQMGVQMDPKRVISKMAHRQGFDDIEELFLTPEEEQQQQQGMMQQQQAQMQQQQDQQQQQMQADMQKQQMAQEHQKQLEMMKQQGAMQKGALQQSGQLRMAQMKSPMA